MHNIPTEHTGALVRDRFQTIFSIFITHFTFSTIPLDGSTPRPYDGDPNTLGIKFRSLPENPKHHPQNRRHHADVQALPAPWTLPVLSGWECEVNAPLDPTSYLLQGTEITAVLDQVASRVPWC